MISSSGVKTEELKGWKKFLDMFADYGLITRNPNFGKGEGHNQNAENFDEDESHPITACLAVEKTALIACGGLDEWMTVSYEDISLAWRLIRAGIDVFCTSVWKVYHKHRTGTKEVYFEGLRSGRGAAMFAYRYPECAFGSKRLYQCIGVALFTVVVLSFLLFYALSLDVLSIERMMGAGGIIFTGLGVANAYKAKHWFGFFFPPVTALLIEAFSWHFLHQYVTHTIEVDRYLQTFWIATFTMWWRI
jgi:hypothetical protein